MATKPKLTKSAKELNGADILNTIRNDIGGSYADQVPEAIKTGSKMRNGKVATNADSLMSLRAIGEVLNTYDPLMNSFLSNLVNRIGLAIVSSRLYENPWAHFKRGVLDYGETIEEIFVAMAQGYQFDPEDAETTLYERYIPDVQAAFHSMNFQKFYPTTVSEDLLRLAFLSWEGLTDLVSRITEQIFTGANYDELMVMKYMIARLALDGKIHAVNIPAVNGDNAKAVTSQLVTAARNLSFMSSKYNMRGVPTYTDISSLQLILTTNISAVFDVEVLAFAFNSTRAELLGRQTFIENFGEIDNDRLQLLFQDDPYTRFVPFTADELNQLNSIQALMCDFNFFMIFDNLMKMTEAYNAKGLYLNYFLHKWTTFSVSPFANAILFTTETPAVTGVDITPTEVTVNKGQQVQFNVTVTTDGFASTKGLWEVSGSGLSTIDENGLLKVSQAETESELTVKFTSLFNEEMSATATVTVA